MKKLVSAVGLTLLFLLINPGSLAAQGTYNCRVTGFGTSRSCVTVDSCDSDFEPPAGVCNNLSNCETTPVECEPKDTPTPAPAGACPASRPFSVCQGSNPDSSRCTSFGPCYGGSGPPFQFCCSQPGYVPPACTSAAYCDPETKPCTGEGEFCNIVQIAGMPEGCSGVCNTTSTNLIKPNSALCLSGDSVGVETAIGCLLAGDPKEFIGQLLGWGVGIGGGIAFLFIVYAGFMIATASGDPKRVQAGRELLMSAISGLILIVISVLLLNFIGVSILNLENIGFNISL